MYSVGPCKVLPRIRVKSFQNRIGILNIFLCFLAHIEYRTVLACAEDILKIILVSKYRPTKKGIPDAETPGNVDIASTASRSVLEAQKNGWLVFDKVLQVVAGSCYRPLHLYRMVNFIHSNPRTDSLVTLLFVRRGVLHPIHVTVFTANFIRPPTLGVAICMALVCPPDTTKLT